MEHLKFQCITLAGYYYAVRHGMKVQVVTPFVSVTCNVTALWYAVTLQVCTHLKKFHCVTSELGKIWGLFVWFQLREPFAQS
jgi:hypothetical protein